MDLFKAMRSFVAVADSASFVAAARLLRLSPPAVTRDVAGLEERFGCKLLHRTTRQVRLTEAGRRYIADARRILAQIGEAEASVAGSHGELRGPITVTAPAMFGRLHVGPAAVEFARRHPRIVLTTLFLDRMVDLVDEGVDVAVRIAHLADSSATAMRVGFVRRVLCASPAFLAAHGTPQAPGDVQAMEAVDFVSSSLPWTFRDGERSVSVRPSVRLVANSVDLAIEAAAADCGVVRLLSYQARSEFASGRLVRLLEAFEPEPVPVWIVHREGHAAPKRTRAFIDHLARALRSEPD